MSRKLRSWLALSISLAVLAAVSWRAWRLSTPLDKLLEQARQAMADKRYDEAETLCRSVLSREPNSAAALLLAGEAATKQERLDEAAEYYARVADDDPQAAVARLAEGSVLLHTNHAAAAERALRACLDLDPHQPQAHERLAWLLGTEGRRFESLPHLYELLRLYRFTLESLRAAGNHDVAFGQQERLRAFLATERDNVLPLIGLARIELRTNPREAGRLAGQVVAKLPEQLEAQALLGRARLALDDRQGLAAWQAQLPAGADEHPDIWLVRGQLAKESGETRAAARCFWEGLRRDANHQAATYQLSQVLQSLRASPVATAVSAEDIAFLATRAVDLEKLAETLDDLQSQPQELELIRRAASLTESLGRLWESWAWHRVAQSLSPDAEWAIQGTERIEPQLSPTLADTLASSDPGQRLDLSGFPLQARSSLAQRRPLAPQAERRRQPDGSSVTENVGRGEGPSAHGVSGLHFREVAAESGIDFTYFRGCQPGKGDGRMFEFTGGGVAVLDFDLDGSPDLYFTQGCRWPPAVGQSEFLDQCYRNLGRGRFACVTDPAHLAEDRFSQGATVGDFNGDGFPDVYVANIGVNRLLMNCGDGTFLDVTSQAGIDDSSWTTSCLMADLNGDGLADLYDVNYVMGDDVFDRVCLKEGQGRTCPPGAFAPEPDRFMLNLGDGRFADRGKAIGLAVSGGNGLGIVAADFEGRGRLGLFVANDQDANFYFVHQATVRNGAPRFTELGVLSGLAFDGQGKAQACMGVAAGDANGDGMLDLFVTNFYQDSNTLYLQQATDSFEDATAAAGLREPSYDVLGFGTQFIDGELDGLPDLVVTNGHVDDFGYLKVPYAMRPQYFHNQGRGRFVEVEAQRLGDFFTATHVGRGLARLDFNRDGREDFAVSHLEAPAALVLNETDSVGHFLALRLHGTQSARDAIGATVRVSAAGRTWTQQLTAGDGYMASNQRQLVFGLGAAELVDELTIEWPTGSRQTFREVAADHEWIVVEGRDELHALPK